MKHSLNFFLTNLHMRKLLEQPTHQRIPSCFDLLVENWNEKFEENFLFYTTDETTEKSADYFADGGCRM